VVGEIARSICGRRMLLVDGGRPVAGLLYVENFVDAAVLAMRSDAAPGHAFNLSDGLSVIWREFTDGLAAGLGCPPVRLTMPYRLAAGIGFSLEHGYRLARRTTHLQTAPLLSRQAVQCSAETRPSARARRGSPGSTTKPAWRRRSRGYAPGTRPPTPPHRTASQAQSRLFPECFSTAGEVIDARADVAFPRRDPRHESRARSYRSSSPRVSPTWVA
jgi:hypothetical protein